jgi:CMP-N,N'-diacetyllegionaminic acid synthase
MLPDTTPVIALIPARGGSKGIKRKNLAPLRGKPLLAYTISAAALSKFVDSVWVSSDDAEILSFAESLGVLTLVRPAAFATDSASAVVVVEHFIDSLPAQAVEQNAVIVYLQPTSPLRNESHIDAALQQMLAAGLDSVISVVEADKPPQKAFLLNAKGLLESLFDETLSNARRQDLPQCYYPNGAIYAFRISSFKDRGGFPSNGSLPFIMSANDSIDIDNPSDLIRAQGALGDKNG